MDRFHPLTSRRLRLRVVAWCAALTVIAGIMPSIAEGSTTLLVNNESFQTIDAGDGSTNRELRFGSSSLWLQYSVSNSRFEFSRSLQVGGTLTATGAVIAKTYLSGASLRISGPGEVQGNLTASGSFRADGDITINDDAGATDATLTFGNNTANQTLKFLNTAQKFQFSKHISVQGTISGSALNVDRNATVGGSLTASGSIVTKGTLSGNALRIEGTTTIKSVNYQFPNAQGGANTFLKNDGAGNLSWATTSVGNGSGSIFSMHPEYPNAVYFSSGSTAIGQLAVNYDSTNKENYYRWTSSKVAVHDQWISVRVRVPDNFSSWDPVKPIEFRYRTGVSAAANNYLTVKMLDTAGNPVALTSGNNLSNTSWTTANITGPQGAGTFTPKSYFTIWVKLASDNTGSADAGFMNLNIETTTP